MERPRKPVWLRDWRDALFANYLSFHARHTKCPRAESCAAGIENHCRSWGREYPRKIEAADRAAHCNGRPPRLAGEYAARDAERRGGTVSIDMPNAQQVCAELLKREVLVDYRPKAGVRFSPHFYNTDEELTKGIAAVE